jgi:excisionase family DNA binding protein
MAENLLLAEEVADLARYHLMTVYKKARAGEIPGVVKHGRSLRFRESAIEAWLESLEQGECHGA